MFFSADILVTTPNRLVHMLQQDPPAIELGNVEWLIFDEADKLFEEGKDGFRDQVRDFSLLQCLQFTNNHLPKHFCFTTYSRCLLFLFQTYHRSR
jgi:hypothetical protein